MLLLIPPSPQCVGMSEKNGCHRALETFDILETVLKEARRAGSMRSIANCAAACSTWKEPALDALWREGVDIIHALEVLSPMKVVSNKYVRV